MADGEATPRPWRVQQDEFELWIEGPGEASPASSERFPKDRRIVCSFEDFEDPEIAAENEANARLIVERVNGGE